jgi:hypothetical protein
LIDRGVQLRQERRGSEAAALGIPVSGGPCVGNRFGMKDD